MAKTLIIATKNQGKAKELASIFSEDGIEVKTLLDYPEIPDIVEDGETFQENALKKASVIAKEFQLPVLADDSGLIVDALGGEPGVYSARYAGEGKDDQANLEKVLLELKGVPIDKRTARFHCTLALAFPTGESHFFEGDCEGIITEEPKGNGGFGYDPIFFVPEKGVTMAELEPVEKNKISHRAKAIEVLKKNQHLLKG
ncbi:deoxyribonucleotide triphosphate pyrophosphatase [Alkalihalobacillus alcalophilus ATCC 27647 = CGMCC 1.3604]|uniref:dITP/XTP pyrophosphatase n=1 Tax=Alkalihalobacillus alcalophilus ATCC 27647 = CGMCC 1.3604 TaxID=1218173 RepID=A0A094WMN4_ALKAL|nr:XTP/dITP diphosphatase [Alkalihalobacillus alcalophilus]KGA98126.1 nucleoside-triphosphate diphosphatase [Alkalihalobacillus alcalophilus ATCC 27647 = CGMCC 1.3604]MED1563550.1 XTP/dITP diphosphatase [Alkalihalobacillus alcalophilus]THG89032.1 deoxyribonucleotide triphosphate pyrophosphatase [Alkalihalobacillus alcalophilus ATCC 27647 = CGMCC 1.3604]